MKSEFVRSCQGSFWLSDRQHRPALRCAQDVLGSSAGASRVFLRAGCGQPRSRSCDLRPPNRFCNRRWRILTITPKHFFYTVSPELATMEIHYFQYSIVVLHSRSFASTALSRALREWELKGDTTMIYSAKALTQVAVWRTELAFRLRPEDIAERCF